MRNACIASLVLCCFVVCLPCDMVQADEPHMIPEAPVPPSAISADAARVLREASRAQSEGRYSECVRILSEPLTQNPNDAVLLAEAAYCAKMAGNLQDAFQKYERLLTVSPDSGEALFNIAAICLETGQPWKALLAFQEFVRNNPDDPNRDLAQKAEWRAIWDLCNRPGADESGLVPEGSAGSALYRKLKESDVAGGRFKAFTSKEILDSTSQVSILLKNVTGKSIPYDLHAIALRQGGQTILNDPSRYLPGTPSQPMSGTLAPGKYAYLIIGCPELDMTLPLTLTYDSTDGTGFSLTF